jgi:hypothetical protein
MASCFHFAATKPHISSIRGNKQLHGLELEQNDDKSFHADTKVLTGKG